MLKLTKNFKILGSDIDEKGVEIVDYVVHYYTGIYVYDVKIKDDTMYVEKNEVVRQIFDWYISGIGSFTISNMLNEKDIKAHRGGIWRPSSVRCVLTNEKYVGDLLGQKSYVENPLTHKHIKNFGEKEKYYIKDHHEAIISREVWDKAQEIYQKRSKSMIPVGKTHNG